MATAQCALSGCQLAHVNVEAVQAGAVLNAGPSSLLVRARTAAPLCRSRIRGLQGFCRVDERIANSRYRREARRGGQSGAARCAAAGAAAGDAAEEDPYQVLGVNPLRGFDGAMVAHRKKKKEAEKKGDKEAMDRYDAAYNKIMMRQLTLRQKGMTLGSLEVSKDIKYADKRAIFPWMPRRIRTTKNDLLINSALSGVFAVWVLATGFAEWKPLQLMVSAYMIRTFLKLKTLVGDAPSSSEFEEEGATANRDSHNRKLLLRSMGLVFSCVAMAAVGYAVLVKAVVAMGVYPRFIATGQELIITITSSIALFIITTWYR